MHFIDWLIVAAYCVFSLVIGLILTRRASKSMGEFILSGRNLPWWLAGTSMVATTFSADTPLAVTGMVRTHGIAGNWFWWNMVMSSMLWTFFYARLWRRTGVLTDVEFLELRYSGKPAAFLRAFKAIYSSVLINSIVMGWVILAMRKISMVALRLNPSEDIYLPIIGAAVRPDIFVTVSLIVLGLIYAVLSGLWGVVLTDFFQFAVAMAGSIMLAVIAVRHLGGLKSMNALLHSSTLIPPSTLGFAPVREAGELALITFGVYLGVQWWAFRNADGGEYIGQRAMACKDERHARLSLLWYSFAHYVLRPWPWILVALVSLIIYPNLSDPESGYPRMMMDFLPVGLRGLMAASMLAAFMSTIDTHLHWGASYLANDIYKRFIHPSGGEKHYVLATRIGVLIMGALAVWISSVMTSIEWAWKFLVAIGAGIGPVYLLRWYWWRINAWSEIAAMVSSLLTAIAIFSFTPLGARQYEGVRLLIIVGVSTATWLMVTLLSPPANEENLRKFYERVRPGGPGWGPIERAYGLSSSLSMTRDIMGAISGAIFIYTSLFAIGKLLLGFPASTWCPIAVIALVAGVVMAVCLRDMKK